MRRAAAITVVLVGAVAAAFGGHAQHAAAPLPASRDLVSLASHGSLAAPLTARRSSDWCGTVSTTDRPNVVAGYPVRVFYAIPSDGQDNSATMAPQIAADIDEVTAWWQREDPSHQPRFDEYAAPCGPQLDISFLKTSTISVGMTDGEQVYDLLWNELENQPGASYTKFIVFLDGVNTGDLCGVGATAAGAGLGAVAMGLATVFIDSCNGASEATIAAHEFLHSISPADGLVGAPHTCPGDLYHVCDSTGDVLYPFVESGIPLNSLQLDVGHDDYYAGTAPVNLQGVPWLRNVQDQVHLTLAVAGQGTVASDVPGVDCTASCGTDWDHGAAVALTATAASGYRFVRWSGGSCSGNGDCNLTLAAAETVSALFAPATFMLGVTIAGKGAVTSTPSRLACHTAHCSAAFTSYSPVVLKAKPANGWRLTGWSGACHGSKAACSVPMTAATGVHATFAKLKATPKKRKK